MMPDPTEVGPRHFAWPRGVDRPNQTAADRILRRLEVLAVQNQRILRHLGILYEGDIAIMLDLQPIKEAVAANNQISESAIQLLNELSARIDAVADNPEEVRAIAAQITAESSNLANAIEMNTPPVEPPAPGGAFPDGPPATATPDTGDKPQDDPASDHVADPVLPPGETSDPNIPDGAIDSDTTEGGTPDANSEPGTTPSV